MSTATFDVSAVRAQFTALDRPLAFFDGPGGTQCPDAVIEAIAGYLRESNANIGGAVRDEPADRRARRARARRAAAFLGCTPEEVAFGAEHDRAQLPAHAGVRAEWTQGDEIVVTKLDHDANIAPWLELAHDLGSSSASSGSRTSSRSTRRPRTPALARGRASSHSRSPRTRSAPRPTSADRGARARGRRARVGRRRALRAARPDRRRGLGRRRPHLLAVQVLRASPGLPSESTSCWSRGGRTRSAPRERAGRTSVRAGNARSTSCSAGSSRPWSTSTRSAGSDPGARARARRAVSRRAARRCRALWPADDERTSADLLLQPSRAVAGVGRRHSSPSAASRSGTATTTPLETMRHLGLDDGAVRAGSCTTTPRTRSTGCSPLSTPSVDVADTDYSGTPLS